MKKITLSLMIVALLGMVLVTSCKKDKDDPTPAPSSSIPADPGGSAPQVVNGVLSSIIPNPAFENTSGSTIAITMAGIKDPATGQYITLAGTGESAQTIWLTEDGVNKGILVTAASKKRGETLLADIVFIVDNSGSMSEEADSIASQIVSFVSTLSSLDVKVGCVGQAGYVNGALNLTTGASLNNYLNRAWTYGTSRTVGFAGSDSAALQTAAIGFAPWNENSIAAIKFADQNFNWRAGAQRIYITFTDEATQSSAGDGYDNASFISYWSVAKGTVHSVFSVPDGHWTTVAPITPDTTQEWNNYQAWGANFERPWKLSTYTGGTIQFIHSTCSDLDLTQLPVTGALVESVMIEFNTASTSGTHTVKITVRNGSGGSDGERTFTGVVYN